MACFSLAASYFHFYFDYCAYTPMFHIKYCEDNERGKKKQDLRIEATLENAVRKKAVESFP